MSKLLDDFSSGSWWIGVVVVSLLVNLASAYLKPHLDGVFLRSSSWWRVTSEARIAKRQHYLEMLQQRDNIIDAYFESIALLAHGAVVLILSCACIGVGLTILILKDRTVALVITGIGFLGFVYGLANNSKAYDKLQAINDAKKKKFADQGTDHASNPPKPD